MHVCCKKALQLAACRLKGVALLWNRAWMKSRRTYDPSAMWKELKNAFLDHYLPLEIREERAYQLLNLQQGNNCVREYSLEFNSSTWNASNGVATKEDGVHIFFDRID